MIDVPARRQPRALREHVRHAAEALVLTLVSLTARLAARTPLLRGTEAVMFVDVDDTVRRTYG